MMNISTSTADNPYSSKLLPIEEKSRRSQSVTVSAQPSPFCSTDHSPELAKIKGFFIPEMGFANSKKQPVEAMTHWRTIRGSISKSEFKQQIRQDRETLFFRRVARSMLP